MNKDNNLSRLSIYPDTICFLFNQEPSRSLTLRVINKSTTQLNDELNNFYNWNLFVGEPEYLEDGSVILNTYHAKIKSGVYNILENRYFSHFPNHLTVDIVGSSVHTYLVKRTKTILHELLT